jgi:hypothetical protein
MRGRTTLGDAQAGQALGRADQIGRHQVFGNQDRACWVKLRARRYSQKVREQLAFEIAQIVGAFGEMRVAPGAQRIGLRADCRAPGKASALAARNSGASRVDQGRVVQQRGVGLQNSTRRAVCRGGLTCHLGRKRGMSGGEGGLFLRHAAAHRQHFGVDRAVMPHWADRKTGGRRHADKCAFGHIGITRRDRWRRGRRGRFVHAAGDQRDQRIERSGAVAALRGQRDRVAMPNAECK